MEELAMGRYLDIQPAVVVTLPLDPGAVLPLDFRLDFPHVSHLLAELQE
jgi:hypothetical protein